ncbi:hypothetical protein [Segetibacter aerophilus]|uniref:Uncharacterized protein n=1 Tax=Segetibacter aerophilus TaxID=670293 RepID=A0A512BGL5_9BACT|nr:hypothetical protein [Segetibacter aerophilus]GEO11110.1 hypothetical protein SAE01_36060 [Segetibacter aerophilus]
MTTFVSCSPKAENTEDELSRQNNTFDTSKIALISFKQTSNWPFPNEYIPTTLNALEIIQLDSLINSCALSYNSRLSEDNRDAYGINFSKRHYKRQYVPVLNSKGEKEVWANFFCKEWENWKQEIVFIKDGGNCFFELKINLTTKACSAVHVNGYA